jgi:uncharacterized SAM-binding protein YcdF (DUF218 family)
MTEQKSDSKVEPKRLAFKSLKLKPFIAFVILLFAGWGIYRGGVLYSVIQNAKPTSWTQDHRGDCGVVLTGAMGRVREGFDLLVQNRISKLIISGVFEKATLNEIFPELPYYGISDVNSIVLEKRSTTTFGNAIQSLALAEAMKCQSVVVITSATHMYRAKRIFNEVFPRDISLSYRSVVSGHRRPPWTEVLYEVIKTMFYSLWAY